MKYVWKDQEYQKLKYYKNVEWKIVKELLLNSEWYINI